MKYIVYNFILTKYSTISSIFSHTFKKIAENEIFKYNFNFKTIDVDDTENLHFVEIFNLKFVPTIIVSNDNNDKIIEIIGAENEEEINKKLKELINNG